MDYKVRILEERRGTESQVRVLIEPPDGKEEWSTVGSSSNIIEASWLALADSLEHWLLKNSTTKRCLTTADKSRGALNAKSPSLRRC